MITPPAFGKAIYAQVQPSIMQRRWLLAAVMVSLAAAWVAFPLWLALLVSLLGGIGALIAASQGEYHDILLQENGHWKVNQQAVTLKRAYRCQWFISLHFDQVNMVIWYDAVSSDVFRRLSASVG